MGQIDSGQDRSVATGPPKRRVPARRSSNPTSQGVQRKASHTVRPSSSRPVLRRKSKSHELKMTAAPLLATVGLLLLVPAAWSALLLIGVGVPGAEREDSRPMAAIMLVCWPIAVSLIAASLVFFLQILRDRKKLSKV